MSILIKGMEMPTDCRECPMETYYNCGDTKCLAAKKLLAWDYEAIPFDGRADWCPLVEVPEPHGRLIDADRVTAESIKRTGKRLLAIDTAPTIIEAEGSENHDD